MHYFALHNWSKLNYLKLLTMMKTVTVTKKMKNKFARKIFSPYF